MKFAVSIFTTLVIIIGAVLFVQYQVYSNQEQLNTKSFHYTQEIEITFNKKSLDIRHHFTNLSNGEIAIKIPENAQSLACFVETETSCERFDAQSNVFKSSGIQAQSITYVIPVPNGLKQETLLKNTFASLENGEAVYSEVHVSTASNVNGQWITGLPLIGEQSLQLINYVKFSGEGAVKDLYWQPSDAEIIRLANDVSVYSKTGVSKAFKREIGKLNVLQDQHISIVHSNLSESGYRMLFLPQFGISEVRENIAVAEVEAMFNFERTTPMWLKYVMATFLMNTSFEDKKADVVLAKLQQLMDVNQQLLWKEKLHALEGETVSPETIDQALGEVLGASTNYFVKNSEIDGNYPFYYTDHRDVLLEGLELKQVDIIYYEGRVLYTADSLLKALGYRASEGENGYYVSNDTRSFRFPQNYDFYVFNQRRYNTASHPVVKLQGQYYIEESWLQRLFLVELTKSDSLINIIKTDVQSE